MTSESADGPGGRAQDDRDAQDGRVTNVSGAQEALPRAEFGFPGPLRDRLVAAVLDGSKTSTTSLLCEYGDDGEYGAGAEAGTAAGVGRPGDPLPRAGALSVLVDSADEPVAVIETTEVRVVPLAEVDLAHARDEGEGYGSVADWRAGHERFWHSAPMRDALGEADFTVDGTTPVVLERFRVVSRELPPR